MKPGLRIDLSICTAGCTVERIGQNLQDESLFRRLTGGNVRWASQRWRTRRLTRVHQAFATTDTDLGAYLRLQAMLAAGGKPAKDNLANNYSFAAVHSLGARDGLEALL